MNTQLVASTRPRGTPLPPDSWCNLAEGDRGTRVWGTALTKTAAEELLDWLEAHGHDSCPVSCVAGGAFRVLE